MHREIDLTNPDAQPAIRLRRLMDTPEDRSQLQWLLECSADYHILATGLPPGPHAAQEMMAIADHKIKPRERHLIGIEFESMLIGYADILRGFPVGDTSVIVDFVIISNYRGRGLGRRCYEAIEKLISQWDECIRIRIGVLAVNSRALPFWQKMGFIATDECFTETVGRIVTEVMVFRKEISRAKD